jgi:hypothetical protein
MIHIFLLRLPTIQIFINAHCPKEKVTFQGTFAPYTFSRKLTPIDPVKAS